MSPFFADFCCRTAVHSYKVDTNAPFFTPSTYPPFLASTTAVLQRTTKLYFFCTTRAQHPTTTHTRAYAHRGANTLPARPFLRRCPLPLSRRKRRAPFGPSVLRDLETPRDFCPRAYVPVLASVGQLVGFLPTAKLDLLHARPEQSPHLRKLGRFRRLPR